MFLEYKKIKVKHARISKLGKTHCYEKSKTIAVLRCDSCGNIFQRDQSKMSPKRRNNNVFHVCNCCDVKRFAQRKGVERRFIWDRPASSSDDISKI